MANCEICGSDIWAGFGSQSRRAEETSMVCRNCKIVRCKKCNLGYFCKKCIENIAEPDLKQELYDLGKNSQKFTPLIPPLSCAMIITGGIALKLGPYFLLIPGFIIILLIIFTIPGSVSISKQKKLMKSYGYKKKHRKFIKETDDSFQPVEFDF